nr:SemiSWEET family transporter [uncultured Cohaesibacter sp.]
MRVRPFYRLHKDALTLHHDIDGAQLTCKAGRCLPSHIRRQIDMIDLLGYFAALLGTVCWIPQLIKVWKTRQTKDLSLSTNLMLFTTMSLWLIYGIAISSPPLIAANVLSALFVGSIISAKLFFK